MKKLIYIFVILLHSCYTIQVYESPVSGNNICKYCKNEKHASDLIYSDGCNTITCRGNGTFFSTNLWCGDTSPLIDDSSINITPTVNSKTFDSIFPNGIKLEYELQRKDFIFLNK